MTRVSTVRQNLKEVGGKAWSEGYELHTRLTKVGRVCNTKQSPTLPKTLGVNVADIWDEGYGLRLEKPNTSVY